MKTDRALSPWERLLLAIVGLAAAGILAIAWRLTPDPRGFGTHEQLGLSACGFTRLTGWACPTCGMTTAWASVLDGDVRGALAANAGGALSCVVAMALAPWVIASAATGKYLGFKPKLAWVLWIGTGWLAVTLFDWARRLAAE